MPVTYNLLAIDDHRDNLTVLRAVLSEVLPDSTLVTTQQGEHGLELARTHDPDAILLDLIMPGMDGYEVCRRLKADDSLREIPVIVLTALGTDRPARVRALEAGADAFLAKPLDLSELQAQVTAMCKLKAAQRWRTRVERDLRASEAKFRDLFEQLPDAITLGHEGVCVDANRRALELLGLTDRSQIVGRKLLADERPDVPLGQGDGSSFNVEIRSSRVVLDGKAHSLTVYRELTGVSQVDRER